MAIHEKSGTILCESEFADLLRKLPNHTRSSQWRCPECGAFLRKGRRQEVLCSPCEEKHEEELQLVGDAQAFEKEDHGEGIPDHRISPEVEAEFWNHVSRNGSPSECWAWTTTNGGRNGFPRFHLGGERFEVRRLSYELHRGPIPPRVHIRKTCEGEWCVNPAHLEAGASRA